MCGLFGFAADERFNRQSVLVDLMAYFASYRGTDSWGIAVEHGDGAVSTVRGLGDICKSDTVRKVSRTARRILGHTRLATVGSVNVQNAHPFDIKGTLVAHNGGIYNYRDVMREDGRVYTVDSQALAWRVALNQGISDLSGYGSVSWLDSHTGNLHVARLSGGDLELLVLRDRHTGAVIHAYISDTRPCGRNEGNFRELADLLDFEVCSEFTPEQDMAYTVNPHGFKKDKARDLSFGESDSSYFGSWRSGMGGGYFSGGASSTSYLKTKREEYGFDWSPPESSFMYAYVDEEGDTMIVRDLSWYKREKGEDAVAEPCYYCVMEWGAEDENGNGGVIAYATTKYQDSRIFASWDTLDAAFRQGPQRESAGLRNRPVNPDIASADPDSDAAFDAAVEAIIAADERKVG